jgi:hypothetical protein
MITISVASYSWSSEERFVDSFAIDGVRAPHLQFFNFLFGNSQGNHWEFCLVKVKFTNVMCCDGKLDCLGDVETATVT